MSETAVETTEASFIPIRYLQHMVGMGVPDGAIHDGQRIITIAGGGEAGLARLYELRDAGVVEFVNDLKVPKLAPTQDDYMSESEDLHNKILELELEIEHRDALLAEERAEKQKLKEALQISQAELAAMRGVVPGGPQPPASKPNAKVRANITKPQAPAPAPVTPGPVPAMKGVEMTPLSEAEILKSRRSETARSVE
jgi:hypothetical protein